MQCDEPSPHDRHVYRRPTITGGLDICDGRTHPLGEPTIPPPAPVRRDLDAQRQVLLDKMARLLHGVAFTNMRRNGMMAFKHWEHDAVIAVLADYETLRDE